MSKMYDNITGRSPIATDDLGYIGTGNKASDILSSGTTDYNDLNNKPTINSVELKGNKTSSDLGLQPELTEAQTNAVNSGITAALTEQITTNQNNISTINNNLIYSPTQPTGDIPDGAIWINTAITALSDYIKKYHVSQNILDESIIANNYTLDTTTGLPATYNGRVATATPIDVENYSALKITYNAAISLMYSTFNANNELIMREINKSSGFTFDVSTAKYLYLCWYTGGNISKDDIGNIMLNAGTTAKPYEPYSSTVWHSNNQ